MIYKFLTHLIAMNGYPAAEEVDKQISESRPDSPAPSEFSEYRWVPVKPYSG